MTMPLGTAPISSIESMDYILFTKDNTTRRIKKSELKGYLESLDYCLDTGTTNTYVLTPAVSITTYVAGQVYKFKALNANTGSSTINVSGVGVKNLVKSGNIALVAGDIPKDAIVSAIYDGTNFQIIPDYTTQLLDNTQNIVKKIDKTAIVNNLTATVAGSVLDATQGKVINDKVNGLFHTIVDQTIQSGSQSVSFSVPTDTNMLVSVSASNGVDKHCYALIAVSNVNFWAKQLTVLNRTNFGIIDSQLVFQFYGESDNGKAIFIAVNNTGSNMKIKLNGLYL